MWKSELLCKTTVCLKCRGELFSHPNINKLSHLNLPNVVEIFLPNPVRPDYFTFTFLLISQSFISNLLFNWVKEIKIIQIFFIQEFSELTCLPIVKHTTPRIWLQQALTIRYHYFRMMKKHIMDLTCHLVRSPKEAQSSFCMK